MGYYVLAKYGEISHMTHFRTELVDLRRGERVIVRSDRGTELGIVLVPPFEKETQPPEGVAGDVLRRITPEDLVRIRQIDERDKSSEMKFCKEAIASHKLPMKLVDVEHIFGGEKIIFYFLAEGRVDFRQLVKDLAKEYRTRIELKQIGVRDEARILADYDHCGREICCRAFIRDLQPVTMKMAKAQKATLDPAKISGRCGRLMCCLRYEDRVYEELKRQLPKKGSRVVTKQGKAEVVDYDIISQTIRVEMEDGHFVKVSMKDVLSVIPRDEKEYQRRQQERAQKRKDRAAADDSKGGAAPQERPGRRGRGARAKERGPGEGGGDSPGSDAAPKDNAQDSAPNDGAGEAPADGPPKSEG